MPAAALISLIVGVLATIMAGFTLISTKENKVSDNRQSWIDAMRDDIAEALAAAFAVERETDDKEKLKYLKAYDECQARIEMREHTSLQKWSEVREALESIRSYINGEAGAYRSLKYYKATILEKSRNSLKTNWEIVKKGEPFFQVFKWTFVGWLAVLGITLLVINGIDLWSETGKKQTGVEARARGNMAPGNSVTQPRLPAQHTSVPSQINEAVSNRGAATRR